MRRGGERRPGGAGGRPWDSWTFTKPVTIAPDERERVVFEWRKPAIDAGDVANG
jgi:hypothetical protein